MLCADAVRLSSARHVLLPKDLVEKVPKTHLMTETEWRGIGVQQSRGWVHYMIHEPGTCAAAPWGRNAILLCAPKVLQRRARTVGIADRAAGLSACHFIEGWYPQRLAHEVQCEVA